VTWHPLFFALLFTQVLVLVVATVLLNIFVLWPLLHNHVYGDLSSSSSHQPLSFLHSNAHHLTRDNFLKAFDSNADGVLDEAEFSGLVQEACAVDRQVIMKEMYLRGV
jgi:hypothetical protein